jgi:hypothetical protein
MIKNNKMNFNNKKRVIAGTAAAAAAILSFLALSTSGAINGGVSEAQAQTGTSSNVITITGTADGEIITIDEDKVNAEICTFAGAVVRGFGVTSVGRVSSCPYGGQVLGWNISPNPSGVDTTYKVVGNGFSAGGLNIDRVEVRDGGAKDKDVYSLDANQFGLTDGFGNDVYNVVSDVSLDTAQGVQYSDTEGNDKVVFTQR